MNVLRTGLTKAKAAPGALKESSLRSASLVNICTRREIASIAMLVVAAPAGDPRPRLLTSSQTFSHLHRLTIRPAAAGAAAANSPLPTFLRFNSGSSSSSSSSKECANCHTSQPLESLSCPSCSFLQPLPSDIDYYKAMDLDVSKVPKGGWEVDAKELKRVWRLRMAVTHPDRMVGRSDKEQQIGAQQSALINRAYETLLNPLLRAQYLLDRHHAAPVSETDSLEDPELLMEVMELREALEDAGSEEEANAVREENSQFLNSSIKALADAFSSNPPDLEKAKKATIELRYWTNIEKAAREWSPNDRIEIHH